MRDIAALVGSTVIAPCCRIFAAKSADNDPRDGFVRFPN